MDTVLRFLTCGSVDDGKSTLIGRLLYDSRALLVDTLEGIERTSRRRGATAPDLSLVTDGLIAEREQGITIDVAYRYFRSGARTFIIADAPGHEQYTRNMVTAASTAQLAVLLVDVRQGLTAQTRRHALLADLVGIPALAIAVNKMDLVGFDPAAFEAVVYAFEDFAEASGLRARRHYIPMSALLGDMVVERGEHLPWYLGPTLLEVLERTPVEDGARDKPFRFPVQWVCRPRESTDPLLHDYRGLAGQVAAGTLAVGEEIVVLPSGRRSRVTAIELGGVPRERALAGDSVMLRLADDLDVGRGEMLVRADQSAPALTRGVEADLVWLDPAPLAPRRTYLLRHTTREVQARIEAIEWNLDVATLERVPAHELAMNDIARVRVKLAQPIAADPYEALRDTGSFLLLDPVTWDTVAAGMIRGAQ